MSHRNVEDFGCQFVRRGRFSKKFLSLKKMSSFRVILLTVFLTVIFASEVEILSIQPLNQIAVNGSKVVLCCRISQKSGKLAWIKDGVKVHFLMNLPGYETYKTSLDEKGDYCLNLHEVTLKDEGKYRCRVDAPNAEPVQSQSATVTVLIPPEPPEILQGESFVVPEGETIELMCVSRAGKPAPKITWIDGHGNVLTKDIEDRIEPLSDGRRYTVSSTLQLVPHSYDNNVSITCRAQNSAERTHQSAKLKLIVEYAPKVSIRVKSGTTPTEHIVEGVDVVLTCETDANPPVRVRKWFANDEPIESGPQGQLIIPKITRNYHKTVFKCQVENRVGKCEDLKMLEIIYGPKFNMRPRSVEAHPGAVVRLLCDVDANPPANITWIHRNTEKVVGKEANLSLKIDSDTTGNYYCIASSEGFPEIKSPTVAVTIEKTPVIHLSAFVVIVVLLVMTAVVLFCVARRAKSKKPVVSVDCNGNQKSERNSCNWIYKTDPNFLDLRIELVRPKKENQMEKTQNAQVRLESFNSLSQKTAHQPEESSVASENFHSLPRSRRIRRSTSSAAPDVLEKIKQLKPVLSKMRQVDDRQLQKDYLEDPERYLPPTVFKVRYSAKDLNYLDYLDLRYSAHSLLSNSNSTAL